MTEALWGVPTSWAWAKISDLGQVVAGGTPSTKEPKFWGQDVVWFSPADLTGYSAKLIRRGAKGLSALGLRNSSARVMPAGSVMFSSRAPIGYVAINAVDAATNQGFKSVVPSAAVFNEYLYYFLKASKQLAEERATGTTFKEISGSAFAVLPVPLAPLPEQHRIVAKIEALFSELDKAVESLTLARAQLKTYRQALLKHAFDGKLTADWRAANADKLETPEALLSRIRKEREARYLRAFDDWQTALAEWRAGEEVGERPRKPSGPRQQDTHGYLTPKGEPLPVGWSYVRLGSVLDVVSGGTPVGIERTTGRDLPFYKVSDMNSDGNSHWMRQSKIWLSTDERDALGLTSFQKGTVIFPKRGGAILTNKKRQLSMESCFDLNTMGVVADIPSLSEEYLWFWFQALDLSEIYDGSNVPQINNKNVEPLAFPVCSLSEQDQLTAILSQRLSQVEAIDTEITSALAKANALRQSILKQAFSGRLVAQDPADETASALLARLRGTAPVPKTRRKKTA